MQENWVFLPSQLEPLYNIKCIIQLFNKMYMLWGTSLSIAQLMQISKIWQTELTKSIFLLERFNKRGFCYSI